MMNRENIFEYLQLKNTNIDNETALQIANLVKMILDLENKDWGNEETLKNFITDSVYLIKDITNNLEQTYKNGYDEGYAEGYNKGFDKGYWEGYWVGNDSGYEDGIDNGLATGHDVGYAAGYEDCYEKIKNEKENHA